MGKRITLISSLSQLELKRIDKLLIDIGVNTCKFSYGINDDVREILDTLPYHVTIFGTDKGNQEEFIKLIETIKMGKMIVKVSSLEVMPGNDNSYVLYLGIENNEKLKELQRTIRTKFPSKYYNPDNFKFHITLDIDKNYQKIKKLQSEILKRFKPFDIEVGELALYDYPGSEIRKFSLLEK